MKRTVKPYSITLMWYVAYRCYLPANPIGKISISKDENVYVCLYNNLTMITYIELWKAKQAWMDLSQEERGGYMTALGPAIQQLVDSGVQIVSWGTNDASTFSKADYDYFAVWTFPNTEAALGFEKIVEGAGWYNYFDQINLMGNAASPQEIIEQMIAL